MATRRFFLLVLPLAVLLGCSGRAGPVRVEPPKAADMVKAALQDLATSGQIGSSIDELKTHLESMKATDSAKAAALLADYDKLVKLTNPQAIKAKAKEMLGKL